MCVLDLLRYYEGKINREITKGNNCKSINARVMNLVQCSSPEWDVSMYEVLCWYVLYLLRYNECKSNGGKITKGNNCEIINARVMNIVHCSSPECNVSMYEV